MHTGIMLLFITDSSSRVQGLRAVHKSGMPKVFDSTIEPFVAYRDVTSLKEVMANQLLFNHPPPKERYVIDPDRIPEDFGGDLFSDWAVPLPARSVDHEITSMDFGMYKVGDVLYKVYAITAENVGITFRERDWSFTKVNAHDVPNELTTPEGFWEMVRAGTEKHGLDLVTL